MVAPVSSCKEYFETLNDRFVQSAAEGVEATYVYELASDDDDPGGTWTVSVKDGGFTVSEGAVDNASVTYQMKAKNYVKLANGEIGGAKAVMTRKLKVSGSIALARKMNNFLPPRKA